MSTKMEVRDLNPLFGAEVSGVDLASPLDDETCHQLAKIFNERGLLLFRGLDIDRSRQVHVSKRLIRKDDSPYDPSEDSAEIEHEFYISNRRAKSAAPYGRLQFHSDGMWSEQPVEVLSLYGVEVEEPVVPTTFVSAANAWSTLPEGLRRRVDTLSASHTAGQLRRGDLSDVLVMTIEQPPSNISPIAYSHPRTGQTILYISEQMTQDIVGLSESDSESLLGELFEHLYRPESQWSHSWREGDLIVWDNISLQHARPNVLPGGPVRTLRKFFSPSPQLRPDQVATFSSNAS